MVVRDDSMSPAFTAGDRLLVDPRPDRPLRVGDVVALRDPEEAGHLLLKRVARLGRDVPGGDPSLAAGRIFVVGDNARQSRDSHQFGPVSQDRILGVVWYRYAPPERRGPVGSR